MQEHQIRGQISNVDLMLRQQQPQNAINSLNATRATLMAKLQQLARQPGAQILQYPQGTPQQSLQVSQAMQWMPPHPSQPRAIRRQMADPKEVQHRALAKLCMAAAPVPDQLGPDGAAAVKRRRTLLEAHDELERNSTWMQELLSPCDAATELEPTETSDAIRERLVAWQVRPSPTSPPSELPAQPPRACARAFSRQARGEQLHAEQQAQHEQCRTGIEQAPWSPPTSRSLPPSSHRHGEVLAWRYEPRVRVAQDARRFTEALGALKQATSLQVRALRSSLLAPAHHVIGCSTSPH